MSEHEGELLTRASATIAVRPLDTDVVVRAAKARRRKRRASVVASLAAAAVVAATAGVVASQDDAAAPAPSDTVSEPAGAPAPPVGMKWVGQGSVVVAVPDQWPVSDRTCGIGAPFEVVYGNASAGARCAVSAEVARVTIWRLDDPSAVPPRIATCQLSDPPTCFAALSFPEQGIAVEISATGLEAGRVVEQIVDSATVMPDGWTTVPFGGSDVDDRVAAIEDAGLEAEVIDGEFIEDGLLDVVPGLGTPVRVGSTVRLAPLGVGSRLPQARYTTSELQRATLDVTAASESGALPKIYSVEANDQLTGLEVSMDRPTVRQTGVTALTDAVEAVAGVDVDLRLGDEQVAAGILSAASERLDVGETASISIYAHCGLRTAAIDGVQWEIEDRDHQPRLFGSTFNFLVGTVTRTAEDRVVLWSPALARAVVLHPQLVPNPDDGCY